MVMTLEERLKAAGTAIDLVTHEVARRVLEAAFPELFTEPPTAWLAPWEPTPRMKNAYFGALRKPKDDRKYSAVEKSELRWAAMRNAFLHPTPTSTDDGGDQ